MRTHALRLLLGGLFLAIGIGCTTSHSTTGQDTKTTPDTATVGDVGGVDSTIADTVGAEDIEPDQMTSETVATGPRSTDELQGAGALCTDPFIVDKVPFHVTGHTKDGGEDYRFYANKCPGVPFGGADGFDEVFQFTPTKTAKYKIRVKTKINLTVTWIATDCGDLENSCLQATNRSNDQWIDITLTQGKTYFIVVDGPGAGAPSEYELTINEIQE